ncbi:MAG: hypothetical protein NZ941_00805 [Candidatus Caldarchaeum sp.]|nr:hypothetical protein [Candidatus Caldarchaeum sp.]
MDKPVYRGLSVDRKPVNVPEGSLFIETDTGREYVYSDGGWRRKSTNLERKIDEAKSLDELKLVLKEMVRGEVLEVAVQG